MFPRSRLVGVSHLAVSAWLLAAVLASGGHAAEALVGRWVSQVDRLALHLRSDGSFLITPPGGKRPPVEGRWNEEDGVITFRNSPTAPVCGGEPGRYRWKRNASGSLRFELLNDTCQPRMTHMKQSFDPAPASGQTESSPGQT